MSRISDPQQKLIAYSDRTGGPDACWPWQRALKEGYGWVMGPNRNPMTAHRLAWLVWRGPLPVGAVLDHTCHGDDLSCRGGVTCAHRRCVNPAHLEVVSRTENLNRGVYRHARTGMCTKQIHDVTLPGSLYTIPGSGKRTCVGCMKDRAAERKARGWRKIGE